MGTDTGHTDVFGGEGCYTVERVRDLLLDIVDRMPDSVNPVNSSGVCVYGTADGRHCIVGQLAYEQGWSLGGTDDNETDINGSVHDVADILGWPLTNPAIEALSRIQVIADGAGYDVAGCPVTWAALVPHIQKGY